MHIRSKIGATLLTGVVGALALASSPAQAAAVCPSGAVCFYQNTNLTGSVYELRRGEVDFTNVKFHNGSSVNDQVSSIRNHTGHEVTVAIDTGLGGNRLTIPVGATFNDLRSHKLNDRLSSAKVD
ncbi:peptidase inhibitor family I36 protein [Streptomyces mirabilis]|uniref:peptidase inhibitor family I36 protein n=1 Tax=Streptomyces mirabilis TaxID=68239 RepID=UPI00332C61D5